MTLKRLLAKPISRTDVEPIISEELAALLTACKPANVFLFGSAARDEMTDASDLDLLVVVADGANLKDIKKKYYCRRKTHMWPVDVLFMEQSEFQMKSQIGGAAMLCLQEGILLFKEKE
jgi:predicted nucleotidyltransferase